MCIKSYTTPLKDVEALIILMGKHGMMSYIPRMRLIPELLNEYLNDNNYLLIFPFSEYDKNSSEIRSVKNHGDFVDIRNVIQNIFK